MAKTDYYGITFEIRKKIWSIYGKNEETIKEDIRILKEWLKTQKHLPEIPSDRMIENLFILNKCSFERTKPKLDMYYSIRTVIPDFFENCNPKLEKMKRAHEAMYFITLPKMAPDLTRLTIFKLRNCDPDMFDFGIFFAMAFKIWEIRFEEDCVLWEAMLFDLEGFSFSHCRKITPSHAAKFAAVVEKVFSNRVKGIHHINSPPFVDTLVSLGRSVMKPKVANRIHGHKDLTSLNKEIPLEMFPCDYGGKEKSLEELYCMTNIKLKEYQDRFDELDTLKVDESLRPAKLNNDDILGFHGNFKKINVD